MHSETSFDSGMVVSNIGGGHLNNGCPLPASSTESSLQDNAAPSPQICHLARMSQLWQMTPTVFLLGESVLSSASFPLSFPFFWLVSMASVTSLGFPKIGFKFFTQQPWRNLLNHKKKKNERQEGRGGTTWEEEGDGIKGSELRLWIWYKHIIHVGDSATMKHILIHNQHMLIERETLT